LELIQLVILRRADESRHRALARGPSQGGNARNEAEARDSDPAGPALANPSIDLVALPLALTSLA